MAEQLKPIPLSDLEEITGEKKGDYWVFASVEAKDGVYESRKYNLAKYINEANNMLQLERRIALTMERSTHTMFIGEEMTIYNMQTHNLSKLVITVGDKVYEGLTVKGSIPIPAESLVTFGVERSTTDPTGYIFIYAKAKAL